MFRAILRDYNETRESIRKNQIEQKERIRKFNKNYRNTIESMKDRENNFNDISDEIDKEISRHF